MNHLRSADDLVVTGLTKSFGGVHAVNDATVTFRHGQINALIRAAMDAIPSRPIHTLDDVLNADHQARAWVGQRINGQQAAPAAVPAASRG